MGLGAVDAHRLCGSEDEKDGEDLPGSEANGERQRDNTALDLGTADIFFGLEHTMNIP